MMLHAYEYNVSLLTFAGLRYRGVGAPPLGFFLKKNNFNSGEKFRFTKMFRFINSALVLQVGWASHISFHNLRYITPELRSALRDDGAFVLTDSIDSAKIVELSAELSKCAEQSGGDIQDLLTSMNIDGSLRATIASKSNEGFSQCNSRTQELVAYYKSVTQFIGLRIAEFLDNYIRYDDAVEFENGSRKLASLVENPESDSLDHFHIYTPSELPSGMKASVPFHVDMGLFLILSPAVWVGASSNQTDPDLVIKRQDGSEFHVTPREENSVIILVGSGTVNWLYPGVTSVRAAVHAVDPLTTKKGDYRVVRGRMFLPPLDTVSSNGVAFTDFFHGPISGAESSNIETVQWRRLSEARCAAGKKYCWMSCVDEPDCGGDESVCMNALTKEECGPKECNTQCKLTCPVKQIVFTPSPPVAPVRATASLDNTLFCQGATSMAMSGFESVVSADANCIILFFKPWLLDSPLKFAFGCIGVFLLGMLVEATIRLRRQVTKSIRPSQAWLKEVAVISLFGLNVALGYLAMLAAMTFNVEIFISTVMGLSVGHLVFANSKEPVRESADACCVTSEATPEIRTGLRNATGACCCDQN